MEDFEPIDKLEQLGINRGDIKKAKDGGVHTCQVELSFLCVLSLNRSPQACHNKTLPDLTFLPCGNLSMQNLHMHGTFYTTITRPTSGWQHYGLIGSFDEHKEATGGNQGAFRGQA